MADNSRVIAAATASNLIAHNWSGRGAAPKGYTKGMAAAFAEAYRKLKAGDQFLVEITKPRAGNPDYDVLDWYAEKLTEAGAKDNTPVERLIAVFTVLLGLGMRESTGRYCEGPDTPQDRGLPGHPVPTTPENAEAGLFQVSFDSILQRKDRQALVDAYANRTDLQSVFSEGSNCVKPNHWPQDVGTGAPAQFQAQTKECPLFAALYAAMLLRQLRKHWGPIIRKEAETRGDAVNLFREISGIVDAE